MKTRFADWSWGLGRLFGIRIRIHPTFLLLLAWVLVADLVEGHTFANALDGAVFLCLVFAIVVLHELAHALTARRFGIDTKDITLLPIGGVSSLERIPERPWQEFLVALAGPALNVVLAAVLFAVGALVGADPRDVDVGLASGSLVERLAWANVTLAVFNLLPAFPMDGGRVLRSLLALRWDRDRATQIAMHVGHVLAVGIGLAGALFNPILLFIAWFVWVGASQEAKLEHTKSLLRGLTAEHAMTTSVATVHPDDSIAHAFALSRSTFQREYPVIVDDKPVGIVSRQSLYEGMMGTRPASTVADTMTPTTTVALDAPLDTLLATFGEKDATAAAVVDRAGRFVGLVTDERLAELLAAQQARTSSTSSRWRERHA